jgi:hypothetical protein
MKNEKMCRGEECSPARDPTRKRKQQNTTKNQIKLQEIREQQEKRTAKNKKVLSFLVSLRKSKF